MSSGSVDQESERTEFEGPHGVIGFSIVIDKFLGEDISSGESDERGESLCEERLCLEEFVVTCPDCAHCEGWMKLFRKDAAWIQLVGDLIDLHGKQSKAKRSNHQYSTQSSSVS